MRSIKDAVHTDLEASRAVYDWVKKLCVSLGAADRWVEWAFHRASTPLPHPSANLEP